MTKLTGAALDRAVANAMGLKSVHDCENWGEHMTEEDEEFQRLEREAKMRHMAEEDDDTQVYKKPWVGLTDEEILQGNKESWVTLQAWQSAVWWAEAKLKDKNA